MNQNHVVVVVDTIDTDPGIDRLYNWLHEHLPGKPEFKWRGNRERNGAFDPLEVQALLEQQGYDDGKVMFWSVGKGWAYGAPIHRHGKEFVVFSNPVMATKFALEFL